MAIFDFKKKLGLLWYVLWHKDIFVVHTFKGEEAVDIFVLDNSEEEATILACNVFHNEIRKYFPPTPPENVIPKQPHDEPKREAKEAAKPNGGNATPRRNRKKDVAIGS